MTGVFTGYCCDVRSYGDRDHRMYDQKNLRYLQAADDRLCFLAFAKIFRFAEVMRCCQCRLYCLLHLLRSSDGLLRRAGGGSISGKGREFVFPDLPARITVRTILQPAVWEMSDLFNSLMVLPNMFCLWIFRNDMWSGKVKTSGGQDEIPEGKDCKSIAYPL